MVNFSSSAKLFILAAVAITHCYNVGVLCFAVGANSQFPRRHYYNRSKVSSHARISRLLSSASASGETSDDDDDGAAIRGGDAEPTDIVAGAPLWPCGDALDRRLTKIALPCIANFAINPLIGAVDLFWVNRMGNALAVAGQAAANQVFSSAFWLASFLPSGASPECTPCDSLSKTLSHTYISIPRLYL